MRIFTITPDLHLDVPQRIKSTRSTEPRRTAVFSKEHPAAMKPGNQNVTTGATASLYYHHLRQVAPDDMHMVVQKNNISQPGVKGVGEVYGCRYVSYMRLKHKTGVILFKCLVSTTIHLHKHILF